MSFLHQLCSLHPSLCLFIAPPAWGKTRMLQQLLDHTSIIYFSPLRALAEEFAASLGKRGILVRERVQLKEKYRNWINAREGRALILTPEIIGEELFAFLEEIKSQKECVVVLDEWHLFFRWGREFRPILLEVLYGALAVELPLWGLTATVDKGMEEEINSLLPMIDGVKIRIDCGNMMLKNPPDKIYYYPNYSWGRKVFFSQVLYCLKKLEKNKTPGTVLLFVPYRNQVEEWLGILRRQGIHALGCVGGEVKHFVQRLNLQSPPRCIVSTTALSHGVNLPQIHSIFIAQQLRDPVFWIQMVGRGGRKGEKYQLHTIDSDDLAVPKKVWNNTQLWIRYQFSKLSFSFWG